MDPPQGKVLLPQPRGLSLLAPWSPPPSPQCLGTGTALHWHLCGWSPFHGVTSAQWGLQNTWKDKEQPCFWFTGKTKLPTVPSPWQRFIFSVLPQCPTPYPIPTCTHTALFHTCPSILKVLLTGSYASSSSACFSLLSFCSSPPFLSEHAPGTGAGTWLLMAIEPIPVMEEPSLPWLQMGLSESLSVVSNSSWPHGL